MAATVGSLRIELSASIAQFQEDMGKAAQSVKATAAEFTAAGNEFKKVGSQMQGVGVALSKAITLPLVGISAAVAKVGMDFEDAFAGVKKTVSGTPQELQDISDAFRDMAKTIPTSATELAKIGEVAGQLGVDKDNVVAFTKTISEIATATHLTAEDAANSFGKLAVVMKIPKDQFESLGSAVYALGNFGSSTEKEMLDMGQRIASAGATVGLTAGQVLGLSNALASAGIDAESGGTAMSRLIIMMAKAANDGGKQLTEFAKVAHQSADEFKREFATDASGAIVKFIEGLGQIKTSGGNLLGTIEALGIKQTRLRDATLSLANAGQLVRESVDLGTKSFSDHTAFVDAVQERYKTTSNQLTILKNRIADVGLTLFTALKPAIEEGIKLVNILLPYIDAMAKAFASLPGGVQLTIIGVGAFAAALGPAIWLSGQMVSSLAQLTLAFGKNGIATRGIVGGIGLVEKAMGALGSAVLVDGAVMFEWGKDTVAVGGWLGTIGGTIGTLISGSLAPLAGVFETVGGAIAAIVNPVTLAIGAFVAVGVAVAALTGHWDDVKAGAAGVIQVVKDVGAGLWYLGTTVIGALVDTLGGLAKLLGSGIVIAFQGLAAVASAVITPFVDFGIAVNDSINNLGGLGTVLKIVGVGLLAVVNPVAGVVAGIALMVGRWDDVKSAIGAVVSVVQDAGTVLGFIARAVIGDLVTALGELSKWLGGTIISGFKDLVSTVQGLVSPFRDLAVTVAGPVLQAFKDFIDFVKGNVPAWMVTVIVKIAELGAATRDLAANGVKNLHEYAEGIREAAASSAAAFAQATKNIEDYRKSVTDRSIPKAAMDIGAAFALLKSQLSGLNFGTNGFSDLMESLKAARAELAALSSSDLAKLTTAVKSGAFSMKEIEEATGLSDMALKLFQGQVRDSAKELKASQSIFDDYKKKVAELTPALTEALKANVPVDFIKRQFGPMIRDVEDLKGLLGDKVGQLPQLINDAFLKITIQEGTDKLQKEFAKFGEDLNKQVTKDMERINASVIKTLGVIVDAGNSTADSTAQFSIEGLKNEIENIEKVNGETAKSHELRKQLAAEEYQYQVTLIQREGQAKKDALDKNDEFYKEALDAIDQATAAKMGQASQIYQQNITKMQTSTKRWTDSLGDLASAFSAIASASDGWFSTVAKDIGGVVSALGTATKASKDFKKATEDYNIAVANGDVAGQYAATAGKIAAVGNGVASVVQATSSKNKAASIAGGALSGGVTGATIGSIVPGIGTAVGFGVGATVGALVGLFRSIHQGAAAKAANDVGRDFGVNISDGLAKELGDLRKTIGQQAANIFDLDKIIAEGGGLRTDNIQAYTAKLRDTFVLVKTGALTAADGAGVLDKNFAGFADYFLSQGPLISKQLVDIVKLTDTLGAKSKVVADFVKQQVTGTILPGLQAFTGASKAASDALVENQDKLKDLQSQLASASDPVDQAKIQQDIAATTEEIRKQQGVIAATAITSQGAADALGATVAVSFSEMMKAGTPILDIVKQLDPVVASLGAQFDAAGFSGGAAFEKIRGIMALASDEIAGPAIQAATGLGQALAGLSNIGQLDQGTFTGLTDQIDATFNSLIAQGASSSQVLALMQQPLQTIYQLQSQFGFAVDDGTKALLDQAVAAGVVGETQKPIQQQMLDATNQISAAVTGLAKVFGVDLPAAAATGAGAVTTSAQTMGGALASAGQQAAGSVKDLPAAIADASAKSVGQVQALTDAMKTSVPAGAAAAASSVADIPAAMDAATAETTASAQKLAMAMDQAIRDGAATSSDAMGGIPTAMSDAAQAALVAAQALAGGIGLDVVTGAEMAANSIAGIPTAMSAAAQASLAAAQALASGIGIDVASGAELAATSIDGIPTAVDGATSAVLAALQQLAGSVGGTLPDAVGGATDAIKVQLDQIQKLFAENTPDAIKAGADAATKLLASLGSDTGGDLDDTAKAVQNYLLMAMSDISKNFNDLPDDAKNAVARISDELSKIKVPDIKIRVGTDSSGDGGDTSRAAMGGRVTTQGVQHFALGGTVKDLRHLFQPSGTDTVPAMLTPGELVLNKTQQASMASAFATLRLPIQVGDMSPSLPASGPGRLNGPMPDAGGFYYGSASLHGHEGAFHDGTSDSPRTPAPPPGEQFTLNLTIPISAMDGATVRDHVVRPGGIADMIVDTVAQGKRGRDERLRRALAISR